MKKVVLVASMAFALYSCGGNAPKAEEVKEVAKEVKAVGEKVEEAVGAIADFSVVENGNTTEVVLGSTDQMTFTGNEIRVKSGTKVKLTLKHLGTMSKDVMGHNFVLLAKGTDLAAFNEKAMEAADNNYIPKMTKEVIANTPIIGGGESVTIEFDSPAAGSYDFICSFPGHYAIMKGTFIVE